MARQLVELLRRDASLPAGDRDLTFEGESRGPTWHPAASHAMVHYTC
jgi:hypothetical protein